DLFDGIDTSLSGLATRLGDEAQKLPTLAADLSAIDVDVKQATEAAMKSATAAFAPLAEGLTRTENLIHIIKNASLSPQVRQELLTNIDTKEKQFEIAAALASGLQFTLKSQQDEVVPGQIFLATATIHNGGQQAITLRDLALDLPPDWKS